MRTTTVVSLLSLLLILPAVSAQSDRASLNIGFTASLFGGVNLGDAQAALQIWAREIVGQQGFEVPTTVTRYDGVDAVRAAIEQKRVHLLLLSLPQFRALQRHDLGGDVLIGVRGNRTAEEYLLVTRRGAYRRPADLHHKSLLILEGMDADISMVWLESLLASNGLERADRHFGTILRAPKAARALMPVYFGTAEACVLSRTAFNLMVEMNPKIGESLAPIAVSPPLIYSVAVLGSTPHATHRQRILDTLLSLHATPRGQQVLKFFGIDRLVRARPEDLAASMELLAAEDRRALARGK